MERHGNCAIDRIDRKKKKEKDRNVVWRKRSHIMRERAINNRKRNKGNVRCIKEIRNVVT